MKRTVHILAAADSPTQVAFALNVGDELTVTADVEGHNPSGTGVVRNASGSEVCRFRIGPLTNSKEGRNV